MRYILTFVLIVVVAYFLYFIFTIVSKYGGISAGTLVLKVTDKINLTDVSSIMLAIDKVEVHRAEEGEAIVDINETMETNETSSEGWITVVNETKSFDLLKIRGVEEFLGERVLLTGKYTQIRLEVGGGTITVGDITYRLIVPSKKFKLVRGFTIEPNKTTTLVFDFDAAESIVKAGSPTRPEYILKPVIRLIVK